VINYLEVFCFKVGDNSQNEDDREQEPSWTTALEFPDLIPSPGRWKLHEIANYFGLTSHSAGKIYGKSSNRRVLIYPRTLFLDK